MALQPLFNDFHLVLQLHLLLHLLRLQGHAVADQQLTVFDVLLVRGLVLVALVVLLVRLLFLLFLLLPEIFLLLDPLLSLELALDSLQPPDVSEQILLVIVLIELVVVVLHGSLSFVSQLVDLLLELGLVLFDDRINLLALDVVVSSDIVQLELQVANFRVQGLQRSDDHGLFAVLLLLIVLQLGNLLLDLDQRDCERNCLFELLDFFDRVLFFRWRHVCVVQLILQERDLLFDVILVEQFLHLLSLLLGFFEKSVNLAGVFFDFFLDFVQFLVLLLLFAVESLQALLQGLFSFVLRVGLALRLADQVTDELVLFLEELIDFLVEL